jgi:hypothetical protein
VITLFLAFELGCGGPALPEALPRVEQLRIILGPVAHVWRDLARAQANPGAAATQYRALASTFRGLQIQDPEIRSWRDLFVRAADRDAGWGEALATGRAPPESDFGPVSRVRWLALVGKRHGEVTAQANKLLLHAPWKNWDPRLTPWLETASMVLDATPPFAVDAHWGPWLPREANRQVAGLAFADQGRGPPENFVARMQRTSGPAEPGVGGGCDLYRDLAGEAGPPSRVGMGESQSRRAGDLLVLLYDQDLDKALLAIPRVVASRNALCPGGTFFDAGLTGRLLLSNGDPRATETLELALAEGRALLSKLAWVRTTASE